MAPNTCAGDHDPVSSVHTMYLENAESMNVVLQYTITLRYYCQMLLGSLCFVNFYCKLIHKLHKNTDG